MHNIKKNDRGLSWVEVSLLVIAAVVLMVAGVTHAWLKNSQVEVLREVDRTQRRISDHNDSINSLQVKIDKKLNIYQLDDDLKQSASSLETIPVGVIEKIQPFSRFQTSNSTSVVAHRTP